MSTIHTVSEPTQLPELFHQFDTTAAASHRYPDADIFVFSTEKPAYQIVAVEVEEAEVTHD